MHLHAIKFVHLEKPLKRGFFIFKLGIEAQIIFIFSKTIFFSIKIFNFGY